MYSFVVYLYVNGSGSTTAVGEERANLFAVVYLLLCGFCLERFPLPLVLGMGYVILLWHSLSLPLIIFQISRGVVLQSRDLELSRNTLYLFSPRLCFFIALKRDLYVYRDDSLTN